MKVFLDTNVLVDYLNKREPFFEDAVQCFSAVQSRSYLILTRDKSGFNGLVLPVMTPAEFLARCAE